MTGAGPDTEDDGMEPTAAAKPTPSSPSVMHRVSLATMGLARPLAGHRIFPLWAVVEHRGRSTAPFAARRSSPSGRTAASSSRCRSDRSTQWTQNVLAAGGARLTWKGRDWEVVDPRVVGFEDAAGPWARCARSPGGRASRPTCASGTSESTAPAGGEARPPSE